ncbi:MAG TPA: hypothetical protein V6D08_14305 [Candidatus Obscuribacterales bacterium]
MSRPETSRPTEKIKEKDTVAKPEDLSQLFNSLQAIDKSSESHSEKQAKMHESIAKVDKELHKKGGLSKDLHVVGYAGENLLVADNKTGDQHRAYAVSPDGKVVAVYKVVEDPQTHKKRFERVDDNGQPYKRPDVSVKDSKGNNRWDVNMSGGEVQKVTLSGPLTLPDGTKLPEGTTMSRIGETDDYEIIPPGGKPGDPKNRKIEQLKVAPESGNLSYDAGNHKVTLLKDGGSVEDYNNGAKVTKDALGRTTEIDQPGEGMIRLAYDPTGENPYPRSIVLPDGRRLLRDLNTSPPEYYMQPPEKGEEQSRYDVLPAQLRQGNLRYQNLRTHWSTTHTRDGYVVDTDPQGQDHTRNQGPARG